MKVKLNRDSKLVSRMYFTWFLLGILYAFFMLILNAFGVQFGFIAFIVIIFGSVQYFMSDKMVLWSSGAKLIERQDDERLFQIVDEVSLLAGINPPKIAYMKSDIPNAFATGRNPKNSLVAVTKGLREKLNDNELKAVIAHEIAHIVNGDVKVLAIANFFVTLSSFLMQMFFWNMLFGGLGRSRENNGAGQAIFLLYIVTMIVYFLGQLLVLSLTRYREYGADHTGASLTGAPIHLASALEKISMSSLKVPNQDLRQFKTANAFMIIPALSGNDISKLMSTHPPVNDRIRKLKDLQKQLGDL
ncbi:MAG: zinc metalloprotease HtpX [Dehalococcoidia bacterium]|nr:zinc metalloprotease HtpX [Dehalococcoidia bacterium]|tara:strand:+ start:830 stop:1735 length:906 start_codon:yes stop_codon:yes gene_type:complete